MSNEDRASETSNNDAATGEEATVRVASSGPMEEPGPKPTGRTWDRGRTLRLGLMAGLAGVLFAGLALLMRQQEAQARRLATREYTGRFEYEEDLRRSARVTETIRSLKLVTVELTTNVDAQSAEESWRGDVSASVTAPVKLFFGTDLSKLKEDDISVSPMFNSCVVRVPAPQRIATEVHGQAEESSVDVGWLRFRSMSGEYHLGQARRDLYERARTLTLLPEDAAKVREQTRAQVAGLVRKLLGTEMWVRVVFDDETPLGGLLAPQDLPASDDADGGRADAGSVGNATSSAAAGAGAGP